MNQEFKIQSIFVTLHAAIIIGGSMFTAMALKMMDRSDIGPGNSFCLWFVRNWGFFILIVPLLWALSTISLERRHYDWFSKRFTIVSGLILLSVLAYFFTVTTGMAGSSLIRLK